MSLARTEGVVECPCCSASSELAPMVTTLASAPVGETVCTDRTPARWQRASLRMDPFSKRVTEWSHDTLASFCSTARLCLEDTAQAEVSSMEKRRCSKLPSE